MSVIHGVRSHYLAAAAALIALLSFAPTCLRAEARQDPAAPKEMVIRIPREGTSAGMATRICLGATPGPAPLVIINHGSPPVAEWRAHRQPSPCGEAARFFTSRGYVVAFPLRRGYGETGGRWAETYGKCESANFVAAGLATADDIAAALEFLRRQPYVAPAPAVIVGLSAGGWGTLALASRNPEHIATFINFSGARGRGAEGKEGDKVYCSTEALVAAAGTFGKSARRATLWIYAENDTRVGPELSRRLYATYAKNGGKAQYELLPPFGKEGHDLFLGKGGSKIWGPIVDRWLSTQARVNH